MADYQIWRYDDVGTNPQLIDDYISVDYSMSVHQIGSCALTFGDSFDPKAWAPDQLIEVRRKASNAWAIERTFISRYLKTNITADGARMYTIGGQDGISLLQARHVNYYSGSTYSTKTDYADDMMKAIVREACGTLATDTANQWPASQFSVEIDTSKGIELTRSFAYDNVFDTLKKISDSSLTQTGDTIYFDVLSPDSCTFQFVTFVNQLGDDHSWPDGNPPVVFSYNEGTLREPVLEQDYSNEYTVVRVAGQGEGSGRTFLYVEDEDRSNRSVWARREVFQDARNESTTAGCESIGYGKLGLGVPKTKFSAKISDSAVLRYGIHWTYGDKVTAEFDNQLYDAIIRSIRVRIDQTGLETIEAKIEV